MPTINYVNKQKKRLSGTTTIISQNLGWNKGALMYWSWREGCEGRDYKKTRDSAADAGTVCHAMIDAHIKGSNLDISDYSSDIRSKAETGFLNFLEWKKMVRLVPLATEVHLVSEVYQYGATPDLIGTVGDKLALIDWKTSNGVYEDHLLQLAAYKIAWEENNPDQPLLGGYHLLRVAKESGSFHHHHWDALPEAWEVFTHLLALHKAKKSLKSLT